MYPGIFDRKIETNLGIANKVDSSPKPEKKMKN